jgi:pimeloyl-ACP methyl ester carboxylesterase
MEIPDHLVSRSINLGFNAGLALGVPWLQVPRSIVGDLGSHKDLPIGYESEFAAFRSLSPDAISSFASAVVSVPLVGRFLRRGSGPIEYPGRYAGAHPDERWFFINGIAADTRLAKLNARALSDMFHRPITILYNATEGVVFDLIESAVGKGFETITESATKNFQPLVDALANPQLRRVILIAHSQGTIVASVLLKALEERLAAPSAVRSGPGAQKESPERRVARRIAGTSDSAEQPDEAKPAAIRASRLGPQHVQKLELYCFANCSTSMTPIAVHGTPPCHMPWIESYGNEYDVVARLGVLAPPHGIGSARIEGDRYRRAGMWGHFMNAHYLIPMIRDLTHQTPPENMLQPLGPNLLRWPRLWDYYQGRTPPPYAP